MLKSFPTPCWSLPSTYNISVVANISFVMSLLLPAEFWFNFFKNTKEKFP